MSCNPKPPGSHFVIRIRLTDPRGSHLEVMTSPIKSCSKMEQIRRKEAEKQGKKVAPKKKRARGEELLETLEEIKTTQRIQSDLLNTLLKTNIANASFPPFLQKGACEENATGGIEEALQNVIETYNRIAHNERPSKLRRVLEHLNPQQKSVMVELGKLFTNLPSNYSSPQYFQSAPSDDSTSEDYNNEPERTVDTNTPPGASPTLIEDFDSSTWSEEEYCSTSSL